MLDANLWLPSPVTLIAVYTCMHACTHAMDTCTHRNVQAHKCIITTESKGVGSTLERPTQLLGLVRIWINILGRYTRGIGLDWNDFTSISQASESCLPGEVSFLYNSPLCLSWRRIPSPSPSPLLPLSSEPHGPTSSLQSPCHVNFPFCVTLPTCMCWYWWSTVIALFSDLMVATYIHHVGCVCMSAGMKLTYSSLVDILRVLLQIWLYMYIERQTFRYSPVVEY